MKRIGFNLAIVAFVVVALVSLIPFLGSFVIAPLVVLGIGAMAGRQAAAAASSHEANEGAKAGSIVGIGALIGSVIGLTILVMFVANIPAVQEYIRTSEPHPEARIPYEWMVPAGGVMGAVTGFFVGLFDFVVALVGGLLAGAVYGHNRRVPTVPA